MDNAFPLKLDRRGGNLRWVLLPCGSGKPMHPAKPGRARSTAPSRRGHGELPGLSVPLEPFIERDRHDVLLAEWALALELALGGNARQARGQRGGQPERHGDDGGDHDRELG